MDIISNKTTKNHILKVKLPLKIIFQIFFYHQEKNFFSHCLHLCQKVIQELIYSKHTFMTDFPKVSTYFKGSLEPLATFLPVGIETWVYLLPQPGVGGVQNKNNWFY